MLLISAAIGYAFQRGHWCMIQAFREPHMTGNATLAKAMAVSIFIYAAGVAILKSNGLAFEEFFVRGTFGWGAVAGGLILGFGAMLAVAAGSRNKPCLVVLEYDPEAAGDTIALVGKGVTDLVQATNDLLIANNIQSVDDIRNMPSNVVTYSEAMQANNRELKDFLYENLYRHWRVMRMASKARRFLTQLFVLYVEEPRLLPWETQARLENEAIHRVVCDYAAGMTDRYALQEYRKLFDP